MCRRRVNRGVRATVPSPSAGGGSRCVGRKVLGARRVLFSIAENPQRRQPTPQAASAPLGVTLGTSFVASLGSSSPKMRLISWTSSIRRFGSCSSEAFSQRRFKRSSSQAGKVHLEILLATADEMPKVRFSESVLSGRSELAGEIAVFLRSRWATSFNETCLKYSFGVFFFFKPPLLDTT